MALGVIRREQGEEFATLMSHIRLPESVDMSMTWRGMYYEVKFFSDYSPDTPFGDSTEWVMWIARHLGKILGKFHINENNEEFEYVLPAERDQ
jgi:hypothetical protein